jgi:hypothetical protein
MNISRTGSREQQRLSTEEWFIDSISQELASLIVVSNRRQCPHCRRAPFDPRPALCAQMPRWVCLAEAASHVFNPVPDMWDYRMGVSTGADLVRL